MTDYNDGKIHGWNGGECPVHPKTVVNVWRRCCDTYELEAGGLLWQGHRGIFDIIAFRVTKAYVAPPGPKTIWVNEYSEDNRGVAYFSEEEAKENFKSCTRIAVKYQEVLD